MGMCLLQSYLLGVLPDLLAPAAPVALEDEAVATGSDSLLDRYAAPAGERDAVEWWSDGGESSDDDDDEGE